MKKINIFNYDTLLFFIIRASYIGICSNLLFLVTKQDNVISVVLSIIIGLIPLIIYFLLNKNNKSKKIYEIINDTFGDFIGNVLNMIIIIYIFIYTSILFWNLISFISSQYLYKTSEVLIGIVLIISIIYALFSNINNICMTSTILFFIFIFLFLISVIGLTSEIDLSNFMPILENGFIPIIKGTYNFIALNILPIFIIDIIPHNKINSNKIFFNTILVYIISLLSLIIVNIYTTTIYGINFVNLLEYPEFHVLKRVTMFGFVTRIENILIIQWIFDILIFTYLSCYYIKDYFNNIVKSNNKLLNYVIPLIVLFVSLNIFKNNTISNSVISTFIVKYNYIVFLIIPLITYIIMKLKRAIFKE